MNSDVLSIKNGEYLKPLYGFDRLEKDEEHNWLWALENETAISIFNPSDVKKTIRLSFSLSHIPDFEPRNVELYLENRYLQTVATPYRYTICVDLMPGEAKKLTLVNNQEKMYVEPDPRRFAFQFYDIACELETVYEAGSKLKKIQNCERNLLKEFVKICENNELTYFMFYGSLLGAVRHGGMIPWDDDIDVAMPREDFDKLCCIAPKVLGKEYFLQTMESDTECFYGGYAKLRDSRTTAIDELHERGKSNAGIWIDILPIDKVYTDPVLRRKQLEQVEDMQKLMLIKQYGMNDGIVKRVGNEGLDCIVDKSRHVTREEACEKLYELFTEAKDNDVFCSILAQYKPYSERQFYTVDEFSELINVKFDDVEVNIPKNYLHPILVHAGQEYMKYPSEYQQRNKHMLCWDTDKPYTWYREGNKGNKKLIVLHGISEESDQYWRENHMYENIAYIVDDNMGVWGRMWHDALVISEETYNSMKERLDIK